MAKICLDAGHGGSGTPGDPGAVFNGRKESDDTLRLAKAVQKILVEQGHTVIMTRTTDAYVSLANRTTIGNNSNADIFVSLHRNSFTTSSANGLEIWVQTGCSVATENRAAAVYNALVSIGVQTKRGVKKCNYHVCRESKMSAMLVELGFISNVADNKLFDNNFDKYALAIAKGILTGLGLTYKEITAPNTTTTGQKLVLGINNTKLTASWKTDSYKNRFGLVHYGVDMVSSKGVNTLYANGNGTVLLSGKDSVLGNTIVIKYPNVYNRVTKKSSDIVIRYYHLASYYVVANQKVTKDTKIGLYGNTGQLSTGAHLHMEVDTDTKNPYFTPTLSGTSTYFKGRKYGANDSTMSNPISWLYCKSTAPDYQTYTTANDIYIRTEDKTIENIK